MKRQIRSAIVGYGPVFNFGKAHGTWMTAVPEIKLVAVCDKDPARTAVAKRDFPDIETYNHLPAMLERGDIDLVSVVVPHNLHKDVVIECLRAGKHTIVDKPMAIAVAECDAMIEEARRAGRTLAVFHNRRHDGNYRTIHRIVRGGELGDVFRIELWTAYYGAPGKGWRSQADACGGALYDWGAHAVDWVLGLVPSPVVSVTGFAQKRVWMDFDIEDEMRAIIRFENGAVAEVATSNISLVGKPLWTILGTNGAIVDTGEDALRGYCPEYRPVARSNGSLRLVTLRDGKREERTVPYDPSDWMTYYTDMARHLLDGAPVPVSGEDGRRVIAVLEAAKRSARSGKSESPAVG